MSGVNLGFAPRAVLFAIGCGLLVFAIANIVLSAAYVIAHGLMYFDVQSYNYGVATGSLIVASIGCSLIFIGWKSEDKSQ